MLYLYLLLNCAHATMIVFGIPIDCIILDRGKARIQIDVLRIEYHRMAHRVRVHTGVDPLHTWEICFDSVGEDLTFLTAFCLLGADERGAYECTL